MGLQKRQDSTKINAESGESTKMNSQQLSKCQCDKVALS